MHGDFWHDTSIWPARLDHLRRLVDRYDAAMVHPLSGAERGGPEDEWALAVLDDPRWLSLGGTGSGT